MGKGAHDYWYPLKMCEGASRLWEMSGYDVL